MQTTPQERKCAHPHCSCPAEPGSRFCSEACQAIGDNDTGNCPCTHDACLDTHGAAKVDGESSLGTNDEQPVALGHSSYARQENRILRQGVSGSYDPKTKSQDRGKPLMDDWGKSDKH